MRRIPALLECADLSVLCYRAERGPHYSKVAHSARGESADKSAHSKETPSSK